MISRPWMIALLLTALFVRILITIVRPLELGPHWGHEAAAVAEAINLGRGFSDPYWIPSGPTAIVPPVYTYLLALIFKVFGIHTAASAYAAYTLNVVLSTLVVWPLARSGSIIGGPRLGIFAAALWAIYPLSGFSDLRYFWSTSLFMLLVTCSLLATLHMRNRVALRDWLAYGALVGFMVVTETVGVIIAGWAIVWLFFQSQAPRRYLVFAVAVIAALLLPWAIRNTIVFNQPMFLRSNFGLELYESINFNDLGSIEPEVALVPNHPGEMQTFMDLGEIGYMDGKQQGALRWIAANPLQWMGIVLRRYWAFWTGDAYIVTDYWFYGRFALLKHFLFAVPGFLGIAGAFVLMRQRKPEGWLFAGIFLLFPLVYTLAMTYPRFRLPIEPLLVLCTSVVLLPLVQPVWNWLASLAGKRGLPQWGAHEQWSSSDE